MKVATVKNTELSAENNQLAEKVENTLDAKDVFAINSYELWTNTISFLGLSSEKVEMDDSYYYYVSFEKWQDFLRKNKTNELQYIPDKFDCDNFSENLKADIYFSERIKTEINKDYGINGIGIVNGTLQNPETKEIIGSHSMNVIFTKIGYDILFFIIEPQNDLIIQISEPGKIVLDGMTFSGIKNPIFQPYQARWN